MKIIKNVALTEEERKALKQVIDILDEYYHTHIDEKYEDLQELACEARADLVELYEKLP